jgi:hypothetical protein
MLAIASVSSLAVGASTFAQTLKVNPNFSIDVTGFSGDPKVLPDAVSNIESLNRGRVAAIAYNNVAGTPGYGVILVANGGSDVTFWRLDKPTGQGVALTGASVPSWMLTWRQEKRAGIVAGARVSLADAIRTAEASQRGAPAVVAGIARSAANSNVHAYMVGILKDGKLLPVAVNSQTGSPIENPSALDW